MAESLSFDDARLGKASPSTDLESYAERAAGGDRAAYGAIYEVLVDDVYGFLRSGCKQETEAEDLVAEVFLKAWKGAKSYRPDKGAYRAWIFAIARNELRDYWRASKKRHEPLEEEHTLIASAEDAPGTTDAGPVMSALATLTADQREVVILRYFSAMSHAEIAAVTGRREGATRALLARALKKLRKVVGDASTY